MSGYARSIGLAIMIACSAPVAAAGWELHPAGDGGNAVLTFKSDGPVSYRFECSPSDVIITETGVTDLLDLQTGTRIGDDPSSVMTPGAALMTVYTGKGDPEFMPADAAKNPAGGWDLTIRLPKNHKQLKALGKADGMSLFTTGYTMSVAMDGDARAKWNDFMRGCNATR